MPQQVQILHYNLMQNPVKLMPIVNFDQCCWLSVEIKKMDAQKQWSGFLSYTCPLS